MSDKQKKPVPLSKLNRAFERSLLQEVLLFDLVSSNGKFSHSEVIQFCLN
jgi:hypothetical protein